VSSYPRAYVLPALLVVALFYLVPNVSNLFLAFTDWNTRRSDVSFVGLDNFWRLGGTDLVHPLWVTIRFALVSVLVQNVLALALALSLERPGRIRASLLAALFVPVLISPIAAAYIWRAILAPEGPLNTALGMVDARESGFAWLGSQDVSLYVLALVQAWKWYGVAMLIYLAGLKAIPTEVREAARVAGASRRQEFRWVTLPLLGPALTFNIVFGITSAFTAYDIVLASTRGGPGVATTVFNMQIVKYLSSGHFGVAAALSLILVLAIALAAVPLLTQLRRREVQL
jgi:raffinose/stachyose/melibiose transport system permease protein